jgi:hypothetical protein
MDATIIPTFDPSLGGGSEFSFVGGGLGFGVGIDSLVPGISVEYKVFT